MKNGMRLLCYVLMMSTAAWASSPGTFVDYVSGGDTMEAYVVSGSESAPLVLIIHDWDGLTEYEVKRAHMLAELGYQVFALDLYGKGNRPTELEDKRKLSRRLYADRPQMRIGMNAALNKAQSLGLNIENAVVIGYCFGGTSVLEWARSGVRLKGFVSFHGGLDLPEGQNYEHVKSNILVFHGSADKAVSMESVSRLVQDLENAGISHELTTYSGAPHAFTIIGSERYREDADRKSWARFTQYLKETLGP